MVKEFRRRWPAGKVLPSWLILCAAVAMLGPAWAGSDAVWEREQQQRRALREAGIAAAGSPMRFDVLRAAIHDADEHDEDQDAIRYANIMYANAGPGTRDRAEAAALLATALEAPDDAYKAFAQVDGLRREAVLILRQRLARKSVRDDVVLLGEVLELRASVLAPERPLQAKRALVALYTAHLARTDAVLLRARRNLAHVLFGRGQAADAEREMRAVIAALPATKAAPAPQFMHELAWLLIARGRYAAAERYITEEFAGIDGDGQSALTRDTRALLWLIARRQGDWAAARDQAAAMVQARPRQFDYRGALMLLEAERALGNTTAATVHVAALRRAESLDALGASRRCVTRPSRALWQGALDSAVFAIEQRELHCQPR